MTRGLDHVVVAVKDLDAAAERYGELGFTVTPENRHAWGTANRLVQLDGFFIELLTVADPSLIPERDGKNFSFGAFNRDFLKHREGISALVVESKDPVADRRSYQALGLDVMAPFSFSRTANLADGGTLNVGFDLTFVLDPQAPDLFFFGCHNRYPENFWRTDFQRHENGARTIKAVYMIARDPADHHEFLGGFTGVREMRATSLGVELSTPRGDVRVLSPAGYRAIAGAEAADAVSGSLPQLAAIEIGCAGLADRTIVPAGSSLGMSLIMDPI